MTIVTCHPDQSKRWKTSITTSWSSSYQWAMIVIPIKYHAFFFSLIIDVSMSLLMSHCLTLLLFQLNITENERHLYYGIDLLDGQCWLTNQWLNLLFVNSSFCWKTNSNDDVMPTNCNASLDDDHCHPQINPYVQNVHTYFLKLIISMSYYSHYFQSNTETARRHRDLGHPFFFIF